MCLSAVIAVAAGLPAVAGNSAIDAVLAAHYKHDAPISYRFALVDLNGDGVLDAIVLITDRNYCGSGGCNLAILRGIGSTYSYVSGSTISRAPIRVLTESRKGWKSLSVWVSGGGVQPNNALMQFNGQRYPLNPTLQPTAKEADLAGSLVIIPAK